MFMVSFYFVLVWAVYSFRLFANGFLADQNIEWTLVGPAKLSSKHVFDYAFS